MIVSNDRDDQASRLSIIPKWGIRRHYGTHFCLEAGGGIGYRRVFGEKKSRDELAIDLHFCIGYTF